MLRRIKDKFRDAGSRHDLRTGYVAVESQNEGDRVAEDSQADFRVPVAPDIIQEVTLGPASSIGDAGQTRTRRSDIANMTQEEIEELRQRIWNSPDVILLGASTPICPICYNLNPDRAPKFTDMYDSSNIRTAYDLPESAKVAQIIIESAKSIYRSNCFTCSMISVGLDHAGVHFKKSKIFLSIIIAEGLPLIVRVNFGSISREPIPHSTMLAIGYDLPGHLSATNVTMTLDAREKPIEIEISKALDSEEPRTIGEQMAAMMYQNIGTSGQIAEHAGDAECMTFISSQMEHCIAHHNCGQSRTLPNLPDRVISIGSNDQDIVRLEERRDAQARYIALSYCWGPQGHNSYLTTAETLKARKEEINVSNLPPLLRDVIEIARRLQIEYIWVDRLCILQGDKADFSTQAPKMASIYGDATLVIAAASARDENDHILVPRRQSYLPSTANINLSDSDSALKFHIRQLPFVSDVQRWGGVFGRMSTRAWTWQERLLAARTVFFTPGGLKFECRHHAIREENSQRIGRSWSAQVTDMTYLRWMYLVEEYTERSISRPSDRLAAVEPLMKRIAATTSWTPIWGLWTGNIIQGLCWRRAAPVSTGYHNCQLNPDVSAPSWSWLSLSGRIAYTCAKPISATQHNDPMRWMLHYVSYDEPSGAITVIGHMIILQIHVTVKRKSRWDRSNDNRVYEYRIHNRHDGVSFALVNDVALEPSVTRFDGDAVPTVKRVPFGEPPPQKSWASTCFGVLLGEKNHSQVLLLLGASSRKNLAMERIGMIDSPKVDWFHDRTAATKFEIV